MLPLRRQMQVVFQDPNSSLNPRLTCCRLLKRLARPPADADGGRTRTGGDQVMQEVGLDPAAAIAIRLSFPAASVSVSPLPGR
jgi:microcin C transport system ATP-binding protein